jgi:hypothetical protein
MGRVAVPRLALPTGVVGAWRMEETSGDRTDSTGNGYTLTDVNTVTSGTGILGNAASFASASSERFSIAAVGAGAFNPTGNFAIWAWVNPSSLAVEKAVMGKFHTTAQRGWALIRSNSSALWRFILSADGTNVTNLDFAGFTPQTSAWQFLAAQYDLGAGRMYLSVNLQPWQSATHTGGVHASTADFNIGAYVSGGASRFDGLIDEAGFASRMLSTREWRRVYQGGVGRAYPYK